MKLRENVCNITIDKGLISLEYNKLLKFEGQRNKNPIEK